VTPWLGSRGIGGGRGERAERVSSPPSMAFRWPVVVKSRRKTGTRAGWEASGWRLASRTRLRFVLRQLLDGANLRHMGEILSLP
jgi:hypothetical protein